MNQSLKNIKIKNKTLNYFLPGEHEAFAKKKKSQVPIVNMQIPEAAGSL